MSQKIEWSEISPPERKRTYVFPGGEKLVLENVARVEVRESGKHRYETADGKRGFVSPGWLWMELDIDKWSF